MDPAPAPSVERVGLEQGKTALLVLPAASRSTMVAQVELAGLVVQGLAGQEELQELLALPLVPDQRIILRLSF